MDRLRRKRDTADSKAAAGSITAGVASRTRAATRDQKIQKAKEAEKEGKENKKVMSSAARPKSKESAASKISNEKENARIPAASSRRAAPSNAAAPAATTATKAPHPSTHRLEEPVKVPPRPRREVATAKAGKASPGSPRKRKKAEATSSTKGSAAIEGDDPKRARCRGQQEDVLAEKTPVPHLLQERLLSRPAPPALLASPVAPGMPLYPRLDVETSTPSASPAAAARSLSPRGQPGRDS
mgnify:CR=1 FL=1